MTMALDGKAGIMNQREDKSEIFLMKFCNSDDRAYRRTESPACNSPLLYGRLLVTVFRDSKQRMEEEV